MLFKFSSINAKLLCCFHYMLLKMLNTNITRQLLLISLSSFFCNFLAKTKTKTIRRKVEHRALW